MYDATLLSIQYHLFSIMSGHFLNVNNVKKPRKETQTRNFPGLSNYSQMLNRTSNPGGSTMKFSAA